MEPKELNVKLHSILEAIAEGRTCEQILAADRTLSYHDIFHAIAEAPTAYWDRPPARKADADNAPETLTPPATPWHQRTD